jgi:Zn-dependent protease
MRKRQGKVQISYSRILYLYFSVLLLFIPVRLLLAAVASAVVHELFHIAALKIMKIDIYAVHIGTRGARLETAPMDDKEELLCALAGPLGGFMLLFLFRWLPVMALTGAVQSLYNLIPIYPTDGGRALRSGMNLILPQRFTSIMIYITEIIALSTIMTFCVYGSVYLRLGVIPVLFSVVMLFQSANRNNPCKH